MRLPDYDAVGDGRLARPYVRSLTSAARASVTVWNAPAEDASDGGDWCEAVPLSEHELALRLSNAGHPPPLLVARGREAFVSQRNNGLPLGIFSHYRATELIVELPPEAIVVFYTDGVTERKRDLIEGEAELVAASRMLPSCRPSMSRGRSPRRCSSGAAAGTTPRSWCCAFHRRRSVVTNASAARCAPTPLRPRRPWFARSRGSDSCARR